MKMRRFYAFIFMVTILLLSFAYYLQYVQHIAPCSLCILQRFAYFGIAVVSAVAFFHVKKTKRYLMWLLIFSAIGLMMSGWQTYLQLFVSTTGSACGPSFAFMLKNFPLHEAIAALFYGHGECGLITWTFLTLSIAQWSLIFFAGLTGLFIFYLKKR
jgi:disulfide bond formation protein DsbB